MTAQNFAVEHAREKDVVGKLRLPRALGTRVDFAERFPDDVEWFAVVTVLHDDFCRGGARPRPAAIMQTYAGRDKPCPYSHSNPYKLSRGNSIASPRTR